MGRCEAGNGRYVPGSREEEFALRARGLDHVHLPCGTHGPSEEARLQRTVRADAKGDEALHLGRGPLEDVVPRGGRGPEEAHHTCGFLRRVAGGPAVQVQKALHLARRAQGLHHLERPLSEEAGYERLRRRRKSITRSEVPAGVAHLLRPAPPGRGEGRKVRWLPGLEDEDRWQEGHGTEETEDVRRQRVARVEDGAEDLYGRVLKSELQRRLVHHGSHLLAVRPANVSTCRQEHEPHRGVGRLAVDVRGHGVDDRGLHALATILALLLLLLLALGLAAEQQKA